MGKRIEWLKLQLGHGRLASLPYALFTFVTFEIYYQLCSLLGYRPRHFLDPFPDGLKGLMPGDRFIVVWPRLPLPIRLLDMIYPGHGEYAPYTPEAEAEAKADGRRVEVGVVRAGVFRSDGSYK